MLKDHMIVLACLLPCLALVANGEHKPDAGTPPQLQASILIVDSKDAIATWVMNPKAGDAGRLRSVTAGQKLFVPIIVTGLKTADFGRPGIVADMQFVSPDGTVMFDGRKCCGASRGDPRTPGLVVLNPVLDLSFEPGDPIGTYEIRAIVTFGNLTASASEKFVLVAGGGKAAGIAAGGDQPTS
jgi:hypothetical protein